MQNTLFLIFCFATFCLEAQTADPATMKQVDSLILLSRTQTDQNYFDKAMETSVLAEDLALKSGGMMSPAFGNACFNHGRVMHFKGNYREAETWYLRSKSIREKALGTAHEDYGKSLNNLAIVYDLMSRHEEAIPLYQQALAIRRNLFGEESKPYADVLSNLGTSYREMGNYTLAEIFTQQALRIRKQALGKNAPEYSASLVNLANLYYNTSNFDEAARLYQQANDIMIQTGQSESEQYVLGLENLGAAYLALGRLEEAESNYLKAKALREKLDPTSTLKHVKIFLHLGGLCGLKGQYDEAFNWYMQAKALGEKILDKDHPYYILTLESLGVFFLNQKKFEKAEAFLLAARDGYMRALGKDHPIYCVRMAAELTKMYASKEDFEAAKSVFMESSVSKRKLLIGATHHLSEREMSAYTYEFAHSLDMGFTLATQQPDLVVNCYDDILFYKGFLLQSALQLRKSALRDSATTAMYHLLKSYHRRLAHEYAKPQRERQIAADLEAEANEIEKQLAHSVTSYGEGIKQVTWQEVQARLKTNEAAIEFVRFDLKSVSNQTKGDSVCYAALLLLPKDESPRFFSLFPENQLVALLSSENKPKLLLCNERYAANKKGNQLYDLIWKPIAAALPGKTVVYCSPSGLLHRINLSAIPTPDGKTLAEKYQLTTLGSTRQLVVEPVSTPNQNATAQLYGGIQYDGTPDVATVANVKADDMTARRGLDFTQADSTLRGATWDTLRWTAIEIATAAKTMKNKGFAVDIKKGAEATEESFKAIGTTTPSPRILHVATHGFFFPDPKGEKVGGREGERVGGRESEKVGGREGERVAAEKTFKVSENPMIRSGLILAGGNHAWKTGKPLRPDLEDGILTAYEISQINLSNTELVVLSACETGLGDLVGNEGVYGLQRAFKIAGARYLIMSLWQVPDRPTQMFMTTFYKRWLDDKMTIPEAFRATQAELKAKYGEAFKWAGFVLVE